MEFEITEEQLLEGVSGGSPNTIDRTNTEEMVGASSDLRNRVRKLSGAIFTCPGGGGTSEDQKTWEPIVAICEECDKKVLGKNQLNN